MVEVSLAEHTGEMEHPRDDPLGNGYLQFLPCNRKMNNKKLTVIPAYFRVKFENIQ